MMTTIDGNDNLYKMVTLGLISQVEAEAQYPKIQELAVKLEAKESSLMCAIAYFTTHGWDFMELLKVMDDMTPRIWILLVNSLMRDDFYNYANHFQFFDIKRFKQAVNDGDGQ
jgi:hypothetical protein